VYLLQVRLHSEIHLGDDTLRSSSHAEQILLVSSFLAILQKPLGQPLSSQSVLSIVLPSPKQPIGSSPCLQHLQLSLHSPGHLGLNLRPHTSHPPSVEAMARVEYLADGHSVHRLDATVFCS
jgi:hypothetical protein